MLVVFQVFTFCYIIDHLGYGTCLFRTFSVQISYSEFIEVLAACAVLRCADPFQTLERRVDAFLTDFVAGHAGGGLSARRY